LHSWPTPGDAQGRHSRCDGNGLGWTRNPEVFAPYNPVVPDLGSYLTRQLDLERHGGRTHDGVIVRILQGILALTAAIWHNDHIQQPALPSLIAYDH
jgi:hypothetical protein